MTQLWYWSQNHKHYIDLIKYVIELHRKDGGKEWQRVYRGVLWKRELKLCLPKWEIKR